MWAVIAIVTIASVSGAAAYTNYYTIEESQVDINNSTVTIDNSNATINNSNVTIGENNTITGLPEPTPKITPAPIPTSPPPPEPTPTPTPPPTLYVFEWVIWPAPLPPPLLWEEANKISGLIQYLYMVDNATYNAYSQGGLPSNVFPAEKYNAILGWMTIVVPESSLPQALSFAAKRCDSRGYVYYKWNATGTRVYSLPNEGLSWSGSFPNEIVTWTEDSWAWA